MTVNVVADVVVARATAVRAIMFENMVSKKLICNRKVVDRASLYE